MLIHRNFDSLPPIRRPAATIGSYDGVHAGHRAILGRIVDIARERGGESVVVTFDPHPRSVVGSAPVMLLNTLPEKLALLAGTGIDHAVVVDFTPEFSRLSMEEFVERDLVGRLHVDTLLVGYNHHLGRDKRGDFDSLSELGRRSGFDVRMMPRQDVDAHKVSSTVIPGAGGRRQPPRRGPLSGRALFSERSPCRRRDGTRRGVRQAVASGGGIRRAGGPGFFR